MNHSQRGGKKNKILIARSLENPCGAHFWTKRDDSAKSDKRALNSRIFQNITIDSAESVNTKYMGIIYAGIFLWHVWSILICVLFRGSHCSSHDRLNPSRSFIDNKPYIERHFTRYLYIKYRLTGIYCDVLNNLWTVPLTVEYSLETKAR